MNAEFKVEGDGLDVQAVDIRGNVATVTHRFYRESRQAWSPVMQGECGVKQDDVGRYIRWNDKVTIRLLG